MRPQGATGKLCSCPRNFLGMASARPAFNKSELSGLRGFSASELDQLEAIRLRFRSSENKTVRLDVDTEPDDINTVSEHQEDSASIAADCGELTYDSTIVVWTEGDIGGNRRPLLFVLRNTFDDTVLLNSTVPAAVSWFL